MVNDANIEQEKVRCKFLTNYFNHMVNLNMYLIDMKGYKKNGCTKYSRSFK